MIIFGVFFTVFLFIEKWIIFFAYCLIKRKKSQEKVKEF